MAGITLTSKTINSTYDSLLKLTDNDGLTASFKKITDGLGNDSGISINNAGNVQISGTLNVSGTTTIGSVLRGNATLTIDPAAHGDNTGLVVIAGDLQVDGTTTTINSTTVSIDDKNILLAAEAANKAAANGAGITVETGTNDPVVTDATILYNGTNDTWDFNKWVTASKFVGDLTGDVTGTVSSLSNHDTDDLSEGATNLYYTDTRFDNRFATKDTDDLSEGTTNLYYTTARFNTDFATKDTDDLSEGTTNLYFTDARARGAFSEGTGVTITNGEIAIGQAVGTGNTVQFDKIGINTVPDRRLHIKDTIEEVIRIQSGTAGAIHFRETSGSSNVTRGLIGYTDGSKIHTGADATDFVIRAESKLHLVSNVNNQGATFLNGKVGFQDYSPKSLLSLRGYGAIDSNANQGFVVTSNHYYDTADKYIGNGYAGIISHDTAGTYAGNFRFSVAGENTAGAGQAMTLTDVMRVNSDGLNVIGDIQGETARFTATSGHAFGDVVGTSRVVSFLNSGLADDSNMYLTIGVAETANNQGEISFYYASSGSGGNLLRLGLYGIPNAVTINGNGHLSVTSGNLAVDSGVIKMGANTVIDASRNYTGGTGTFSGNLQVDDKITITGTNNNLLIDEESENTWHLYDTFQDNGIIIHSSTGGMEFQYNGVTEMTIDGGGVSFTGTIDLSNANLNIGSADIVFDTISTNANRGLVWDVDGSYLSKLVSGGTNTGMVEIYTNMDDGITGDVFRIKTGSTASTVISIANDEDISINGKAIFNDVAIFKGQASDYDGSDRGTYWSYDDKVAIALEPAADDGAVAMIFKSIGNAPSDFAYIAYDEDWGEAGATVGENGTLLISSQNDGINSSDHVRVLGRLVVQAETSSSNPTNAFQVKSSNVTTDLFRVARSGASVFSSTLNVADQLTVDDAIRLTSNPSITGDSTGVYFWNQAGVGATIASNAFQVKTGGNTTALNITNSQDSTFYGNLHINANATNTISFTDGGTYTEMNADVVLRVNQRIEVWGGGTAATSYLDVRDQNGNRNIMLNGGGDSYFSNDLGIGTTSPIGKVNIRQTTLDLPSLYLSRYNADDNPLLQIGESTEFSGSASYGEALIHSFNRDIVFSTESADVFTDVAQASLILEKTSGNVLFPSPSGNVHIYNTTTANANFGGPVLALGDTTSEVGMSGGIAFTELLSANPTSVTMGIYYDGKTNRMHFTGSNSGTSSQGESMIAATKHLTLTRDTGYFGIGVNPPSYRLEVSGQAHIQGILSVSTGQQIRIGGASDGNHFLRKIATGYSGFTIDGPQLQGHQGGELSTNYLGDNWALRWAIGGNVVINNTLTTGGSGTFGNYITFTTGTSIPSAAISYHTNGYLYMKGGGSGAAIGDDSFATSIYCIDNGNIEFNTAGTGTKMVINSSGYLGVGETNPQQRLHINGVMRWGSSSYYAYSGVDGGGLYIEQVDNNTGRDRIRLQTRTNNSGTYTSFLIDAGDDRFQFANGDISLDREYGVTQLHNNKDYNNMASGLVWREYNATGTYAHATSSETLSDFIKSYNFTEQGIASTVDGFTRADDTYAVEFVGYYYANTSGTYQFSASSDDSSDFFIDGTRVAYWYGGHGDNNAPTGGTGQVAGSIYLVKGFHRLYARFQEGTGGDSISLWHNINSGGWAKISSDRLFHKADDLFRATGSGNATLYGTFTATADIVAYSDERIKENVETIDNALDKVQKLRGVSFNRKADQKKSIGVIAQEIEKVLPEVVTEDEQGIKGVSYGNIVGVLIEAVKEQQKQIDELKKMLE